MGQPELRATVLRPDLTQFAQRVAAIFHLPAMDAATVRAYVRHRLQVAGATWEIFSPSATELVHQATRGVPRLVNQLCDLCLFMPMPAATSACRVRRCSRCWTTACSFGGGAHAPLLLFRGGAAAASGQG